ncbi:MAG: hypothetical protein J7452_00920 [Thermoflexus sp.]|jgi:hypothetical protein|nr:hypothetical protein [Thermoflexus sp.]
MKVTIYDVCRQAYVNEPMTVITAKVSKTLGNGNTDLIKEHADAGRSSPGTNRIQWTTDSSVPGGGF